MGNDRKGRGKYQRRPEVCGPAAQGPHVFLGSCQLIKAKSLPIPAGIPHQTARGAFYPNRMPPLVTVESLCTDGKVEPTE
ncbi:hypothetical protein CesoFtcFv8_025432 [Champsocephalus esox]|uniref:Uncharacterized protein n=1 Tax=Champsocephalus esox TaxID=159716 RepID=A0AAN8B4A5_9TELE|nr:hypothetical protein CesoFtcFv8_025432 [Champsocephalus esox]